MAYIRKIKGSLVRLDSSEYIGEESYLFYDIDTACIRITDGTPGGRPACIEGTAGSLEWGNITGTLSNQLDLQAELDALVLPIATDTVLGGIKSGGDISVDPVTGLVTVFSSGGIDPVTTLPPNTVPTVETIFDFDSTVDIAVKYLVVVENIVTGESQSAEVHAFGGLGKNTFNIQNKLGDKIKYTLELVVNGATREMQIINNEPDSIRIRVTRLGAVKL